MTLTSPLKWHGGKHYLVQKLKPFVPPHLHRVESYGGGGSFTLGMPCEGVSEVLNDINEELTNFWCALQNPVMFASVLDRLKCTPFSQWEWNHAVTPSAPENRYERAVKFFIRNRQAMAGRMGGKANFAPVSRNRTRRGMNEQVSAWMTSVDELLPAVAARIRRVLILNQHAPKVIKSNDGKQTFHYIDPTYLPDTRATTGEYVHEMTIDEHVELLDLLPTLEGTFMLSGYDSELYREREKRNGWHRLAFDLPNNAAGGDTKRRMQEIVWTNFKPKET